MDREQVDETLRRIGMASFIFYPEIQVDEPEYRVDDDAAWCLAPIAEELGVERTAELRAIVARAIIDPTQHRQEVFEELVSLLPALPG